MALFKKGIYQIDDKILKTQSLLIEKIKIQKFTYEKLIIERVYEIGNNPIIFNQIRINGNFNLSTIMNDNSTIVLINLSVDVKVLLSKLKISRNTLNSWIGKDFILKDFKNVFVKSNNYQDNNFVVTDIDIQFIDLYKFYISLLLHKDEILFNRK